MTLPMAALSIDMMTRLAKAPRKTVIRGCLVAMIAAIKKVLSPVFFWLSRMTFVKSSLTRVRKAYLFQTRQS